MRDLVSAAGGNTTLAQYGIIYIDEVDKIASGGGGDGSMSFSRGDLARGVQNNFLKLLEDTDVPLQGNSPFEMMSMGEAVKAVPRRSIPGTFSSFLVVRLPVWTQLFEGKRKQNLLGWIWTVWEIPYRQVRPKLMAKKRRRGRICSMPKRRTL